MNQQHANTDSQARLGAFLALAATLLAAQAQAATIVYSDNCNGNDFSSRYTFSSTVTNAGYSAEFPPASAGNMAMADTVGLWNNYQPQNGFYLDSSNTTTFKQFVKGSNNQQQLALTLLDNGWNSTSSHYNGYRFYLYVNGMNDYYAGLYRDNADGSTTTLVNMWDSGHFGDSKIINAWSDFTFTTALTAGSTDITVAWSGVKADGTTPYSYTLFTYSDTSAGRYASGNGLGFGLQGASGGNGYFLDNITVTAVPEPACLSLLALGGLGLLRRRQ